MALGVITTWRNYAYIVFTFFVFIALWVLLGAYLIGFMDLGDILPDQISALELPKNTTELGDSLAILDGLLSSIAIVLGLMAIIFQGRELKESTKAQTEQAQELSKQMHQQTESNKLAAYTARLQFLLQETDRLGIDINRLIDEVNSLIDEDSKKKGKQKIWIIQWHYVKGIETKQRILTKPLRGYCIN